MMRHEVLAIHYSAPKPPPVGESPLTQGKSLPTTPTLEPVEEDIVFTKPSGKKRLSVREMVCIVEFHLNCKYCIYDCVCVQGRKDVGGSEGPPAKKRKKSGDKRNVSEEEEELTPFQYEGTDYTQYTQQGDVAARTYVYIANFESP